MKSAFGDLIAIEYCQINKIVFTNLFPFVHLGNHTLDQMLFLHCMVSLLKMQKRKKIYQLIS